MMQSVFFEPRAPCVVVCGSLLQCVSMRWVVLEGVGVCWNVVACFAVYCTLQFRGSF